MARKPTARPFPLRGANLTAYHSRDEEVLLAGPAGTGKTSAWLAKVGRVCGEYAGARCLVVRKTRASLTESVLVTWERDVLGPGHPLMTRHPILRRVRQSYQLANGSVVALGGMDTPDKVLSSEWDLIYVPEATELTLVDWETLGSRLRAGRVPHQQLVADCNPTTPTHWLYQRCLAGRCRLLTSKHQDNPRYFDPDAGVWTPAGAAYLRRLERMTGARRKRFLEGVWAAAEGLVYDGYDPARHLLPAGWSPAPEWPRVWGLDFGFTNPLCLQFWAVDPDGRVYLYREFYRTGTMVQAVARWAGAEVELGREPRPLAVVCDHDPENAAVFAHHSGQRTTPAEKFDKLAGIQQVQARFDLAGDGRPRIFFRPDAVERPRDQSLLDLGKPIGLVEELAGYVWDTGDPERPVDEPVKKDDHAADACLYVCRWVDANLMGLRGESGYGYDAAPETLPAYLR